MKTGTLLRKWTAALCAVLTLISLFALPVLAHEETETVEEASKISTELIVWLIVVGVILIAAAVLCIIFREKVAKFFRVYKSEAKKIVWLPWSQTKKSTLVVLVVLVVFAVAIALIDLGLSKGFLAFIDLFRK